MSQSLLLVVEIRDGMFRTRTGKIGCLDSDTSYKNPYQEQSISNYSLIVSKL